MQLAVLQLVLLHVGDESHQHSSPHPADVQEEQSSSFPAYSDQFLWILLATPLSVPIISTLTLPLHPHNLNCLHFCYSPPPLAATSTVIISLSLLSPFLLFPSSPPHPLLVFPSSPPAAPLCLSLSRPYLPSRCSTVIISFPSPLLIFLPSPLLHCDNLSLLSTPDLSLLPATSTVIISLPAISTLAFPLLPSPVLHCDYLSPLSTPDLPLLPSPLLHCDYISTPDLSLLPSPPPPL